MSLILPKISVIVPVYNVENYVSKCIQSIINQSYKNLEIILINDGSTDKSGDICECYAKQDDRIILIHQENQGLSMARNNALDLINGDYISFIDSDDWIDSDMIYILYNNIVKYGADIAMCNFYCVDQNGKLTENNLLTKIVTEDDNKIMHYFSVIVHNTIICNKLYNKNLFNEIRFPCNKIHEDVFITHQLIDRANRVAVIPDHKYYYLSRNDSITKKPFTFKNFDIVEACISRYDYISTKYPKFENICRRYIFTSLLDCMYKAYINNIIDIDKEKIEIIIKRVQEYNTYNCGLSKNQEIILKILFDNIMKYTAIIQMVNN